MEKVLVIFGGRSAEHDISIITAHTPIMESLRALGRYEVIPLYIAKDGRWYSHSSLTNIKTFQAKDFAARLARLKPVDLRLGDGLSLVQPGWGGKATKIDVVFTAMHGTYGEDGSLMGLLRMADVPFVGCDLAASAVSMDKVLTKQVAAAAGVPGVKHVWFWRHQWQSGSAAIKKQLAELKYPLFVKPAHLGSSIGITKVNAAKDLARALEVAMHYDDKVLIEEGVVDLIEVTLPIIGNDSPRPALLERPLNKTEFFDFEDKYLGQGKKTAGGANQNYSQIPAQLDPKIYKAAEKVGVDTYRALGCAGIARVDMLIDAKTKRVYLNEVNPLPGSLYHHNWRQAGLSSAELVGELLRLARERYEAQRATAYVFESSVLQKAGGKKQAR